MDIEGSERFIKQYTPNLAICIYHKLHDIVEIPEYIHSLVPEYKMKVRQHSNTQHELVLYAYIED